ncbi:XRE family transcriptional regulator [Testudinibacter sp. P80/BLE/0925]
MTTLATRLQAARNNAGLTQVQLAEKVGISQNAIQKIESEQTKATRHILKIANALNVNPEWLETGNGSPTLQLIETKKIESNVGELGTFDLWDRHTPMGDDEVAVPFYKDIRLAAGNGLADDIADYNGFKLRFSKATLRRAGVQYENAVCVTASGNSMEPAMPDGATVGVNLGDKNIKDGQMYAINHGGLLRIKILYLLPNSEVRIRSYNTDEHQDEVAHLEDISVIGKVFWWSVLL